VPISKITKLGTTPAITAPVLSGTTTGTYTLGGTPTISAPVLSGTATGTYTLGGTPTITNPTLTLQSENVSPFGGRNRLINGAMVIDQRNVGASVTPDNAYTLDRWKYANTQAGKATVQQNAGSVTPPVGFQNYLGVTSASAYSVVTNDFFVVLQNTEGYNMADFDWGTANAKTVTLSFWVRSSLTGTFGGTMNNSAGNRSYPFSYTISSANTWEQKSITVAGDTTGTWLKTNGNGMQLAFGLGVGSGYSGTAGAWSSTTYLSSTGATSVVGTNGATFYITGVQLEKGTVATPFEFRSHGQELALCQRYYYQWNSEGGSSTYLCTAFSYGTSQVYGVVKLPVTMRTTPALTTSGTASHYGVFAGSTEITATVVPVIERAGVDMCNIGITSLASPTTNGFGGSMRAKNASGYLGFSSEL